MANLSERLVSWWERLAAAYRARRNGAGLILLGILIVGETLLAALGNDVALVIARAVGWFIRQPMGVGGLLFLGLNLILVGHAYFETRPAKAVLTSKPATQLSADDKDAIAKIRHLWRHEGGAHSAEELRSLVSAIVRGPYLANRPHLASLMRPVCDNLETSARTLEEALEVSRAEPLDAVIERFNAFYGTYLRVAELLSQLDQSGDVSLSDGELLRMLQVFQLANARFQAELVRSTSYPGVNSRLKVFPSVPNLESFKFLGVRS